MGACRSTVAGSRRHRPREHPSDDQRKFLGDLLGDPLEDIAGVAPEYPVAWSAAKALDDGQEFRWLAALVTVRRRFPVRCTLRRIGHSNSLALSDNQAKDESSPFSKSATHFKTGHLGSKPASTAQIALCGVHSFASLPSGQILYEPLNAEGKAFVVARPYVVKIQGASCVFASPWTHSPLLTIGA